MKTKLFDKNLYIEGLNQLKTAGLICFIISILGSILSFISTCILKFIIEDFSSIFNSINPDGEGNVFIHSTSCGTTAIYLFTPIFTYILFNFLFKRNASDFYHSLSVKRETLFCTFSLSALTMSIGIVTICGLFSIITNGFILGILDYSTILPNYLNIIAGCLLIQSAVTIGCSVSGRFFPSFVASLMIVFYPRIFITALLYTVKLSTPIIDSSRFDMPLGNSYNVLTGAIFHNYTEYKSVIYSVILAAIYYLIAIRFFRRRESENAKKSGTAKQIKAPMRIAFCLIFCLPAIIIEYLMLTQNFDTNTNLTLIIPILVLYFFSLIAYFLIELFSQGRYKNFGKIVLQFGWVVLLNILLLGGLYISREVVVNYTPTAETVDSITIRPVSEIFDVFDNELYYDENLIFDNSYVTDKTVIADICEKYNQSKPKYNNTEYAIVTVGFNEGNSTKYRVISVTKRQLKSIVENIDIDDEYMKTITTIPEKITYASISNDFTGEEINSDTNPMVAKVYETSVNEIKSFEESEFFGTMLDCADTYSYIQKITCYDENNVKYEIPYCEYNMPKTKNSIQEATVFGTTAQQYKDLEFSLTHPIKESGDEDYNSRSLYCYDENELAIYWFEFKEDKNEELLEYIKTEGKVYSEGKVLFEIYYNFNKKPDENSDDENIRINTTFTLFDIATRTSNEYADDTVYFFIDKEHINEFFTVKNEKDKTIILK